MVVRQPPGEENALGRLAFMFPNDHAVYLHDTPARALFGDDMRALSHGCVRVEDPRAARRDRARLAGRARVEAAIGGPERTVFLPRPMPIHIEYFTAFVDADGELRNGRTLRADAKSRPHIVREESRLKRARIWVYTPIQLHFPTL